MQLITTKSFTVATYSQGDPKAKKFALVLPGKLDTKDYTHLRAHVDYLATRGYFALSFDPPGTWESPGGLGIYTTTNYLKAANELIEYFGNKPTLVLGHSRGSSMATLLAISNPHVTGLVSLMCSLVPGALNYEDPKWKAQGYNTEWRDAPPGGGPRDIRIDLPYGFHEDQRQYDIADGLSKCTKPKLFFYGTIDDLAPPEKVKTIYNLAAEPKEIYPLESGHDYRLKPELIAEVNTRIGKFLDTYNL